MTEVPVVIVVGSINVDLVTTVGRLPSPGETVIGGRFATHGGGKGANQAVAAARLGAQVTLIGAVGDDDHGRRSREELASEGVDLRALATVDAPTGVASILVDESGENLIAVASGANGLIDARLVGEAFGALDHGVAVVLASLEVPLDAVEEAARLARERGWTFVLNPAPARPLPAALVGRCEVITPNETEAGQLGGAEALLAAGAAVVVVTRGDRGVGVYRPGLPTVHYDAFKVDAVDATGAGDAFSGTLAWALASGWSIERAVEAATAAGALATTKAGARAGIATRDELESFIVGRAGKTGSASPS